MGSKLLLIIIIVSAIILSSGCVDEMCENAKTGDEHAFCALLKVGNALEKLGGGSGEKEDSYDPCKDEKGAQKDRCLLDHAKVMSDPIYCDKIKDKKKNFNCNVAVAADLKDSSYCDKLDLESRAVCISKYYEQVQDLTIKDCDMEKGTSQVICFYKFAYEEKDVMKCSGIPKQELRSKCIEQLVKSTSDPTICRNIKEESSMHDCVDETIQRCKVKGDKNECMKKAITALDRPGLCDIYFNNDADRNLCWAHYAQN